MGMRHSEGREGKFKIKILSEKEFIKRKKYVVRNNRNVEKLRGKKINLKWADKRELMVLKRF